MQGSRRRSSRAVGWLGALIATCAGLLLVAAGASAAPSPPLPGGAYVGKTDAGKRLKVKVDAASRDRPRRGRVILARAGSKARFEIDGGRFVAKRINRSGKLVFKATGHFEDIEGTTGKVRRLHRAKRHGRCAPSRFSAALANSPPITEKTVRYGPFNTEPSGGHGHGGGGHNVGLGNLEKPCEDCYLVGIRPDLVDADGSSVNFDTGGMLHHVVFFNRDERDATCSSWPERFFASGNERGFPVLPRGYGYPVDADDNWALVTHIMNLGEHARDFWIELTFFYADGASGLGAVKPFWLDINNCGSSQYMTPAGLHTEVRDFTVDPSWAGKLLAVGGHLHDHGVRISLSNASRGKTICSATADYGSNSSYEGHIESVGGCSGRPLARIAAGETLRLRSRYDAPEAIHDVMGIMTGWVAPSS